MVGRNENEIPVCVKLFVNCFKKKRILLQENNLPVSLKYQFFEVSKILGKNIYYF